MARASVRSSLRAAQIVDIRRGVSWRANSDHERTGEPMIIEK